MIDVLKTRLSSSVSNWYTDDLGNLILESVNGKSAMQLCGEGFGSREVLPTEFKRERSRRISWHQTSGNRWIYPATRRFG